MGDNEADGFIDMESSTAGNSYFVAMSFNADGTEARYAVNSDTWTTFDPHDIYLSQTEFIMFASRPTFNAQVGIEVGMLAVTEGYWNSASDPSLANMLAQANTLYNLGL